MPSVSNLGTRLFTWYETGAISFAASRPAAGSDERSRERQRRIRLVFQSPAAALSRPHTASLAIGCPAAFYFAVHNVTLGVWAEVLLIAAGPDSSLGDRPQHLLRAVEADREDIVGHAHECSVTEEAARTGRAGLRPPGDGIGAYVDEQITRRVTP
jgi:hypothetical protein